MLCPDTIRPRTGMSLMNGRFTTGDTILWILPAELDLSPLARNNTNTGASRDRQVHRNVGQIQIRLTGKRGIADNQSNQNPRQD